MTHSLFQNALKQEPWFKENKRDAKNKLNQSDTNVSFSYQHGVFLKSCLFYCINQECVYCILGNHSGW